MFTDECCKDVSTSGTALKNRYRLALTRVCLFKVSFPFFFPSLPFKCIKYPAHTRKKIAHARPDPPPPSHAQVRPGQPYSSPTPALLQELTAEPDHCLQARIWAHKPAWCERTMVRSVLHLTWPPHCRPRNTLAPACRPFGRH